MPGLLPHGLPQSGHLFRRQTAEQGVQLVRIVCVLLPSGIQDALHIALPLFLLHRNAAGPNAGETGIVILQQRIHCRQLIGVQLPLPVRLPGEGKQFLVLGGLCLDARRVLIQLLCQIRQALHIRVYRVPIHPLEKRFYLGRMGRLVPSAPGLRILCQRLIFEESTALDGLPGQILVQIGADAALGRVDLQPGEDGQCFRLLPAARPPLGVGVFVIGNDASVQRGIADLADAGGEGAANGLKACLPVVGTADLGLGRRDHQQRNVLCVGEGFVFLVAVEVVVAADAGIQDRIRYGLDHIAVVVSAAQPLRSQHIGIHHHHIRQVPEIVMPHLLSLFLRVVEGKL